MTKTHFLMRQPQAAVTSGLSQQPAAAAVDTPTMVDKLAQWLEADKCVEMHQSYESTGNVEALAVVPPMTSQQQADAGPVTSYINCSNKSALQGGTITINPTSFVRLPADFNAVVQQDTDRIPVVVNEVVEEQKLPLPVVQTNRKRTMVTRSLSRQVSEVNKEVKEEEEEEEDPDYAPAPAKQPPAKKSRRSQAGRKPKTIRGDYIDDLPPDEREKVQSRRQKNKEAAARCRQKRVDLTNKLSKEVEEHQLAKVKLEQEIKKLRLEQMKLRRVLENHQAFGCQLHLNASDVYTVAAAAAAAPVQVHAVQQPQPEVVTSQASSNNNKAAFAIKSAPVIVEAANAPYVLPPEVAINAMVPTTVATATAVSEHQPLTKPLRPQTLTLPCSKPAAVTATKSSAAVKDLDEDLETPSKIVANLFEQSGFTPTSIFGNVLGTPTCSLQQKSSEINSAMMAELSTPSVDTISLTAL